LSPSKRVSAAIAALLVATRAFAAHPLQTEDTGTQGAGNLELENGLAWSRFDGARLFSYQPQLSFGAAPTFDLIVQPSWLAARDRGGAPLRGWGDANVDLKWRFFGVAPLSFAVRVGASLATSEHGMGLSHGQVGVHALLAATLDLQPFTVHGNLGFSHAPSIVGQRSETGRASAAVMWAATERLIVTVDAGAQSKSDPQRGAWSKTALVGLIYTVQPSLDIDVGFQSSVGEAVPTRQRLAGITYRFAP
jgi:hypothetical protein